MPRACPLHAGQVALDVGGGHLLQRDGAAQTCCAASRAQASIWRLRSSPMNIDRKSFLLLATAIATSTACLKESEETSGAGGSTGDGGQGATAGSTADGGASQGGAGGGVGGSGGAGGAGTCDDTMGTPGDCGGLATSCSEGFDQVLCEQSKLYFKPAVAEAAVTCMIALGGSSTCSDVWACRNDALANACPDTGADQLCTQLIGDCALTGQTITDTECHDLLDGMTQAGRDAVETQCGPSVEGSCFQGFYATLGECVDNLY